ncbi:MAG TPA: hypothetical protein VEU62_19045 [Bryobacterales bacterium]|nr:hypothetical protein [Bryobacterales bacterium]
MGVLRRAGLWLALAARAMPAAEQPNEGEQGRMLILRTINFLILAAGLGYLIKKYLGPYYKLRGEGIQREIAEAQEQFEESEARAHAIEERLSDLDRQIAQLKADAKAEIAAEHARLEREAEQAVKKVFALAEQEMGAMAKAARLELKSYAAALAVGLAETKIAGRITPQIERGLVGSFVRNLSA